MDVLSPSGIDPKTRVGSDILIDSDVPQDLPIVSWVYGQGLFGSQHNSNLYAADLAKLVRFANDDNSPFAWTDASKTQHSALASALRSGTVYEGSSVAIAVGQPAKAELQALLDPKTSSNADTNFVDPAVERVPTRRLDEDDRLLQTVVLDVLAERRVLAGCHHREEIGRRMNRQ